MPPAVASLGPLTLPAGGGGGGTAPLSRAPGASGVRPGPSSARHVASSATPVSGRSPHACTSPAYVKYRGEGTFVPLFEPRTTVRVPADRVVTVLTHVTWLGGKEHGPASGIVVPHATEMGHGLASTNDLSSAAQQDLQSSREQQSDRGREGLAAWKVSSALWVPPPKTQSSISSSPG